MAPKGFLMTHKGQLLRGPIFLVITLLIPARLPDKIIIHITRNTLKLWLVFFG